MHVAAPVALDIGPNGFTFVVFGTVAFSLLMSILFFVTRGTDNIYDHIGQGGLSRDSDAPRASAPALSSAAERAEQEAEVRQMITARSERLVRRGEAPLDVDAEVARLLAPLPGAGSEEDPGLAEEVRQLVVARNERRVRQGLEPLEVEAEVARTLEELKP